MTRLVLGMAKRFLDLRGAKAPKLEVDYLRLLFAIKELCRRETPAQGYLLVMTPEILATTTVWRSKYQGGDAVRVLVPPLSDAERSKIEQEVLSNTSGMLAGTLGLKTEGLSSAAYGAAIAENYLASLVEVHEPRVVRETREELFPFTIRWDYYGSVTFSDQTP